MYMQNSRILIPTTPCGLKVWSAWIFYVPCMFTAVVLGHMDIESHCVTEQQELMLSTFLLRSIDF
jgi:hypothetical protein